MGSDIAEGMTALVGIPNVMYLVGTTIVDTESVGADVVIMAFVVGISIARSGISRDMTIVGTDNVGLGSIGAAPFVFTTIPDWARRVIGLFAEVA